MVATVLKRDFSAGIPWPHVCSVTQPFVGTPSWPAGVNDSGCVPSCLLSMVDQWELTYWALNTYQAQVITHPRLTTTLWGRYSFITSVWPSQTGSDGPFGPAGQRQHHFDLSHHSSSEEESSWPSPCLFHKVALKTNKLSDVDTPCQPHCK